VIYDADAHVMETSDFLAEYVDPKLRERVLNRIPFTNAQAAEILAQRQADDAKRARAEERLLAEAYKAHGAWDSAERSHALDRLGFSAQLVFPTFATGPFAFADDNELRYAGARAYNRAIVDWCSVDERLHAVGYVPFHDPDAARIELDLVLEAGCKAVLVHSSAVGGRAPSHPDLDSLWARLADADVPFVLHIGTGGKLLPDGFRNNGRAIPPDIHGGGENIRSKDYVGIHHWPETYLSVMAMDGVFERHPNLRGASIEQGAAWAVTMCQRVDHAKRAFKNEPDLVALPEMPSVYLRRQVKYTPFPGEDVGWIVSNIGADTVLFSTDYPHYEGGRDPIAKFEATMETLDSDAIDRFYRRNYLELLGIA
jgi:predicted TIM-barrel fold metal-dependent hydrolase